MEKFLTIDGAGWCTVTLGDFTFRASYLTDVPFDCLKAAIKWLTDRTVFAVNFDGEGETCVVISNFLDNYVVCEKNSTMFFKLDEVIDTSDLALQIYKDISEDVHGWAEFVAPEEYDDGDVRVAERKINGYLDMLKSLLTDDGMFDD